uniref:Uncharacterized protein n=1 Tax=Physcomitrium patens TaxID=3218 RepID=A0A2K1INU0_PHYPA|nr:hypothetical protein PHYPA_027262 [Physcomitrium patens]
MRTFLCLGPWWWKKSALHLSPTLVHLGDTKVSEGSIAITLLMLLNASVRSCGVRSRHRSPLSWAQIGLQWRGRCARWCRCECITDGGGVDAIGLQKSLCVRLQLF